MAGDWEETSLAEVMDVKHGFAFSGENIRDEPPGDILLTPGNFAIGGGFKGDKFKYFDGEVPADYVLSEGDLVVTMTDLSKQADTLGYPALVPKPRGPRFLHNQRLGKVLIKNGAELDKGFLFYLLCTAEYRHEVLASATGTTVKHTSPGRILAHKASIPALAEQKAIAAVLGALDDKIELNQRMNATLEAMARALFQSWFVDFDPVRAKLDGRSPVGLDNATAALFPAAFQESRIGDIPHGWAVGTIDEATSLIIDYRGKTPKKMGSDWSATGIPAVSAKNVKGGRLVRPDMFNFVSEELYERWMKDKLALGDILMTSEAPLGELHYLALNARFCLSQRIFAMRAHPSRCEPTFLYYWLESPACQTDIRNRGSGTTVEGIRQSELRKVSVLLPPIPIQKAAAKFLVPWTEQIHRNEEQSRTLATLRDTLLPKLLSGELRVGPNLNRNCT
jgi:type I restriction enzyme S subunit